MSVCVRDAENTHRLDKANVGKMGKSPLQLATQMRPGFETLLATRLVEQTKRRQADRQILLADGLRKRIHELHDEPASLLRCPTIVIRALVGVRQQELLRQISVSTVDLDAVESDLHCRARCATVVLDCLLDVVDRQLDGRVVDVQRRLGGPNGRVRVALCRGVPWQGGRCHDRETGHLRNSDTASVPQLAVDIAALFVDSVDNTFPAGGLFGSPETGDTGHAIALPELVKRTDSMFLHTLYTYLQRRRDTLGDDETPRSRTLAIVLDH